MNITRRAQPYYGPAPRTSDYWYLRRNDRPITTEPDVRAWLHAHAEQCVGWTACLAIIVLIHLSR